MKKSLLFIGTMATLFYSCGPGMETTESGITYKIISHQDGERAVNENEMLLVNFKMAFESNDSLIIETFSSDNPRYIPADEASLREVFAKLSKGDSVEILINADTLYQKSFGVAKPAGLKDNENVKATFKVVDIFSQSELDQKRKEQMLELQEKDSVMMGQYLSTLQNVKTTPSGLKYIVEKPTNGKQAKKGSKVTVKYKGYFMNGEVFDENLNSPEPFEFMIGLGQVISGWDEGLQLMKEGEKFKMIIPWQLAYGERGSGPILPCTSLVFDVELIKVN